MLAPLALLCLQTPAYTATVITFAPNEVAFCSDLNDKGEIAGFTGENDAAVGFVWKDGAMERIQAPSGGGVYVRAINNDGTVIGFTRGGGVDVGFKWTRQWGTQKFMDGQRELMPLAIADGDLVAGVLYDVMSRGNVVGVWRPNSSFEILAGANGNRDVEATGINADGVVVGHPEGRPLHAFVMAPGQERKLLDAPVERPQEKSLRKFSETVGSAINNAGWVSGWYRKGQSEIGCVWSPERKRTDVGGGVYLRDINDAGVAVGSRSTGDAINPSVAVVWDKEHGVRELNNLAVLDKTKLNDARAINNRGEILCAGTANGSRFWFVLRPG